MLKIPQNRGFNIKYKFEGIRTFHPMQFQPLPFQPITISIPYKFNPLQFQPIAISTHYKFNPLQFQRITISTHYNFNPAQFQPTTISTLYNFNPICAVQLFKNKVNFEGFTIDCTGSKWLLWSSCLLRNKARRP